MNFGQAGLYKLQAAPAPRRRAGLSRRLRPALARGGLARSVGGVGRAAEAPGAAGPALRAAGRRELRAPADRPRLRARAARLGRPRGAAARRSARGRFAVVAFVYLGCHDAAGCPLLLASLQQTDRRLGGEPGAARAGAPRDGELRSRARWPGRDGGPAPRARAARRLALLHRPRRRRAARRCSRTSARTRCASWCARAKRARARCATWRRSSWSMARAGSETSTAAAFSTRACWCGTWRRCLASTRPPAEVRRGEALRNRFWKGHALGNDYLVVDPRELDFRLTPRRVRALCDRHRGVGGDGCSSWSPRGRLTSACGSGTRTGAAPRSPATACASSRAFCMRPAAPGAPGCASRRPEAWSRSGSFLDRDGAARRARVEIGRASFEPRDLPSRLRGGELLQRPIRAAGRALRFTGVSIGNPHCVVFAPRGRRWSRADLLELGPRLERHPSLSEALQRAARDTGRPARARDPDLGARRGRDAGVGHLGLRRRLRRDQARLARESGRGARAGRRAARHA